MDNIRLTRNRMEDYTLEGVDECMLFHIKDGISHQIRSYERSASKCRKWERKGLTYGQVSNKVTKNTSTITTESDSGTGTSWNDKPYEAEEDLMFLNGELGRLYNLLFQINYLLNNPGAKEA